jgi:hypothetical protein
MLYTSDHPYYAGAAFNLGSIHRTVFERDHREADFASAVGVWRRGAGAGTSPSIRRTACARQWAELAAAERRWDLASEGYARTVELLPLVAWRGLKRSEQEAALVGQAPVPGDAAAAAMANADPVRAVEQLEQGRGVLWTQRLEMRHESAVLRERHPDLSAVLDGVRRALDGLDSPMPPAPAIPR